MDFRELLASILQPSRGQVQGVQQALDEGWLAERSEDYERAFAAFEQAIQRVQVGQHGTASALMAQLHQAEIRLRQGRSADAEALVQTALASAQGQTERAYATCMIGVLAQAKGDWVAARAAYERALDDARAAGALGAEGRALGHLGASYLHDGNASYAIHLLRDALTKLNASGDLDLNSLFTGLLGQALIQSGQPVEGMPLIERALRIAVAIGYRFYERQWAALLGRRALAEGRYQDAATYSAQVLRLFPPDTVSADSVAAAVQMSKVSLGLRKTDEALGYAQIALDGAEKLGDPAVKRVVQGAYGVVLRAAGRSSEAIPFLQAAAGAAANASAGAAADDDHVSVDVLRALAAAEVDNHAFDAAVATYQRAIQQAEAEGSVLELAQTRRDLGLAQQKQGDFNAAIAEWSAALTIYDQQRAYAQVARLHCDIGSTRKLIGQRGRAIKDYEQALMVLNSLSESETETRGLVLSNAANAYAEQGDAESADAFFTESIAIAERLGDRAAEATRCGNYGWFLLLVGRPRRALATLERALTISESLKLALPTAVQYDNLGLVYDSLGDTALALERHRKALTLVSAQGDPLWTAQIKVNLANTLIAVGSLDEAQPLLDDALAQAQANSHAEVTISARIGLGRLRIAQGQPGTADDLIAEAIMQARKIENRRLLAEALSLKSQQQAALDQQAPALAAWDEAQRLYRMLHMPQGKTQPIWLTQSATQP